MQKHGSVKFPALGTQGHGLETVIYRAATHQQLLAKASPSISQLGVNIMHLDVLSCQILDREAVTDSIQMVPSRIPNLNILLSILEDV